MADKTDVTVSVMPKVEEKIVELSGKLEQIMAERAPEAWDAALAVVQIDAFGQVIAFMLAVGALLLASPKSFHEFKRGREISDRDWGRHDTLGLLWAVAAAAGFVVMLANMLTIWQIVALFRPELIIAKRILDGVL